MIKEQFENVITPDFVQCMIDDYNSRESYQSDQMKKATAGASGEIMSKIVLKHIWGDWEYTGGNFYKHTKPYFPHTDFKKEWNESLRVVIPLSIVGATHPSLVVFDQWVDEDSVTWFLGMQQKKSLKLGKNIPIEGKPYEYPGVQGLTNEPIDDDLYELLSWAPKESWFSLSGDAFKLIPGSMLVFNNKFIHTTGNFQGTKLGLSLHFKRKT